MFGFISEQATLRSEQSIRPLCKPSKPQMAGMMVSAVVYEIKGRIYKLPSKYKKTRTGQVCFMLKEALLLLSKKPNQIYEACI